MTSKFDEIKNHFLAQRQANAIPRKVGDIPLTYEAITPQWLTAILASTYPGIAVESFTLDTVDEGTSSRRRDRKSVV